MFCADWRMALAVLWVIPVAVLLTVGSKRLQDRFGTHNILAKRATTDCIQEGLETVRDLKAATGRAVIWPTWRTGSRPWSGRPSMQS